MSMTLGEKLRSARLAKGLSQTQTAGSHMTRNMLSQLENDLASPSVRTLQYLAQTLDISIGWLLDENSAMDSYAVTRKACACYVNGEYLQCLELLSSLEQLPDEEQSLLLFRSACACAEQYLKEQDPDAAQTVLRVAGNCRGVYIGEGEKRQLQLLKLRCKLAFEETDDELVDSVRMLLSSEGAESLLAQHCLLKGQKLFDVGDYENALLYLHEAERSLSAEKAIAQRLYRLLELCYKQKEDFKMAYYYSSINR